MNMNNDTDVYLENHGSIMLLRPVSESGNLWISAHVEYETWQWFGNALGLEPRYVAPILEAMREDGLTIRLR